MPDAQVEIFDRLLEIALLIQQDLASSLGQRGLTVARTHLLWELGRLGPSTQQALATALQVSPRNITGLVDALEADGFVSRRTHPSDRRALLVSLSVRGQQVVTEMERERGDAAQELLADVAGPDLEVLRRSLATVAARLSQSVSGADGGEAR